MKILFQVRSDLFKKRGGDTVQIEHTAKELRTLGVSVDIESSNSIDLSTYDVVHIFQLDWICEPYLQAVNAKKYNKPLVLSPIHHSNSEVENFEMYARYDFRRVVNLLIPSQEYREVLKNFYRAFIEMNFSKVFPTFLSLFEGFRNEQKIVIGLADIVIVQTEEEARNLREDYKTDFKWKKIVNGVAQVFFSQNDEKFINEENYILTVGRIEARKNQLRIIEAVQQFREEEKKDVKLVVIGEKNSRNPEFSYRFEKKLKEYDWILYFPKIVHEKMFSVYSGAKVCVSASWFETTGLTLLEAVISGCNVVSPLGGTGKRVKEYLSDIPFYCDVVDVKSIKEAIRKAYYAKRPEGALAFKENFTWTVVAKELVEVYTYLLKEKL